VQVVESLGQMLFQLWSILGSQLLVLRDLLVLLFDFFTRWPLLILWIVWWLLGVNWKKMWGVLGQGAWLPLVLVAILAALAWSQIAPSPGNFLGLFTVPNFWWQLGNLGFFTALALFCGYLQGRLGWAPAEIDLEPPASPAAHH
jgi:hypothetical protein